MSYDEGPVGPQELKRLASFACGGRRSGQLCSHQLARLSLRVLPVAVKACEQPCPEVGAKSDVLALRLQVLPDMVRDDGVGLERLGQGCDRLDFLERSPDPVDDARG